MDEPSAYYEKEITNTSKDTVELLIYANKQINRKNSPIENVVIDLTLNAGGEALAAVCVPSWLLGYCDLQLEDVSTGTQGIVRHQFDVNLDHEIDEQDCLLSNENIKGIYCLVSSFSFSCANLVPAALKGDPDVTIIGQTSGGGACCVQTLSSADGNTFNISGNSRINTVKNGSFYSVDQGVTPDIFFPSRIFQSSFQCYGIFVKMCRIFHPQEQKLHDASGIETCFC